ncbi:MAG: ATP-binding protein [Imperialibacter sp.]|uniref:ATP-binding protein n=1 Tax=Imperialibacter sp. TaxID=2038411 RepID=UPI0032EF614F
MASKTKIGKDVIESLTMGMYEDSRFIYREYVQNSADQIDLAVETGLLNSHEEGYIDIEISKNEGVVSIKDNATGIKKERAAELLKDIAMSSKDRTKNKGFRGIGRLGGLGYCHKLVFVTSFKGEDCKTILTWNSKLLREIINDRSKQQDASSVIDEVTTVEYQDCSSDEHFFEVTLIGVNNELLLEKAHIEEYLSMVAPVPFDKGFIYSNEIIKSAADAGHQIDVYNVFVNHDQVFKAYTSTIYSGDGNNRKRSSEVIDIQSFEIDNSVWGWYSISDNLTVQIPAKANVARGIRLRKGNIQIGDDSTLAKFFAEERFNYYFFGEIHVFDKNLIPNARRDYFIENDNLKALEENLRSLLWIDLSKLVRYASSIKSIGNNILKFVEKKAEFDEKQNKGFTDKTEEKRVREELDDLKEKARKAELDLQKEGEKINANTSKGKIFNHLAGSFSNKIEDVEIEELTETRFITDSLSKLDRKERKLISRVFSIIDQVLPKELAENLKEKVKEGFQ